MEQFVFRVGNRYYRSLQTFAQAITEGRAGPNTTVEVYRRVNPNGPGIDMGPILDIYNEMINDPRRMNPYVFMGPKPSLLDIKEDKKMKKEYRVEIKRELNAQGFR